MIVKRISPISGRTNELDLPITQEQIDKFNNRRSLGMHVQTIFPELTPDQREFILTWQD